MTIMVFIVICDLTLAQNLSSRAGDTNGHTNFTAQTSNFFDKFIYTTALNSLSLLFVDLPLFPNDNYGFEGTEVVTVF